MPKPNPVDRLANYARKMNPERIGQDFSAQRERMVAKQSEAIARLTQIEGDVRGVLANEDVSSIQYIWYISFARKVFGVKERFSGGKAVDKEAAAQATLWASRGCSRPILVRILAECFSINIPA